MSCCPPRAWTWAASARRPRLRSRVPADLWPGSPRPGMRGATCRQGRRQPRARARSCRARGASGFWPSAPRASAATMESIGPGGLGRRRPPASRGVDPGQPQAGPSRRHRGSAARGLGPSEGRRRVLPTPPGPVSVSSRAVPRLRLILASSSRRPTKLVSSAGSLVKAECELGDGKAPRAYAALTGGSTLRRSTRFRAALRTASDSRSGARIQPSA